MSLQSVETPRFWIVAGPNGSGKSTLHNATDIEGFGRSVWIINPDLGVETVLSTDKYRRLVELAKATGFEFRLIYITLRSASLNVERVRSRVLAGGHGVPEDKILERRERSFQQLPWFLEKADFALIYDNRTVPVLVGRKQNGLIEIDPSAPPEIKTAVDTLRD